MDQHDHEDIAHALYDHPDSRAAETRADTTDRVGDVTSRRATEPPALLPPERQHLADHHETLTTVLNLDKAARERMRREFSDAVPSEIGPYDYNISKELFAAAVRAEVAAKRGTTDDTAHDAEQYESLIADLRGLYGDDGFESTSKRVQRYLRSQPKFSAALKRAKAQNAPTIVRGLFEFVRRNDLGREDSGTVLDV
jgi:hypothetical protein